MKRALLIGINYFNTPAELAGCINDVLDMKILLEEHGYTTTLLTDTPADPKHTLPDAPTHANILRELTRLAAATKTGDTLYVHYSGHGAQLSDRTSIDNPRVDEEDGFDECLCPVDCIAGGKSLFIRDDTIFDVLVAPLPAGSKLRVVFDACHSGSALDLPLRWSHREAKWTRENDNEVKCDAVFVGGCLDQQLSADAAFAGRPNGALTKGIIRHGLACKTWEKMMSTLSVFLSIYNQHPQLSVGNETMCGRAADLI